MLKYIRLTLSSFSLAIILIYGIGALWAVFAITIFTGYFEEFRAVTLEGHFVERFSFFFSFLAAWFLAKKKGWGYSSSEINTLRKWYLCTEAALVTGLCILLAFLLTYWLGWVSIQENSNLFVNTSSIIYQFIVIAVINNIIITIGEEMVYRGVVFIYLFRKTEHLHISVMISSLIFSLMHFQYAQPISFLIAFTAGSIFAYTYHYSKSLIIPIGMHFSYNFFMEIFKSEEKVFLAKILNTDFQFIEGIGDSFAFIRFFFLLIAGSYIFLRFSDMHKKQEKHVI